MVPVCMGRGSLRECSICVLAACGCAAMHAQLLRAERCRRIAVVHATAATFTLMVIDKNCGVKLSNSGTGPAPMAAGILVDIRADSSSPHL